MKRRDLALMVGFLLLGGGWLARGVIFQSEASRVERILNQLAAEVSFATPEGNIAAVRRISGVVDHFTADASIEIEILGSDTLRLSGRDEIQQALMMAHRVARGLTLKFHDLVVTIEGGGQSADVDLTATAEAVGRERNQEGFEAIEFDFKLHKVEGNWRIQKVTTVPTLKQ